MRLARKAHGFLIAAFCLLAAASSHAAILHEETLFVAGSSTSSLNVSGVQGGTDRLYLTAVTIYETGVSVSSISGGGLTWTLQKAQCSANRPEPRIEVWQAFGSPGAAFSTVVTLSGLADRASAAVSRYSGADPTTPTEGAAGSNTNGLNGACAGGTDSANLSLSLTSTLNDSVLYVASHPRHETLTVEDAGYTQQAFISNSTGSRGANLYVHDRTLATAGTDMADHTASLAVDWDMAGLVIRPASSGSSGAIYYSVGTDNTTLYSDTALASVGALTLNSPAADNIGVGDEIREGANRYYITGRNSATEFAIQNSAANFGTPGDTNITFTPTAITIFRAFNSLTAAVAGSSNVNHLNTFDLVTGNFQLNWTCYDDAALNDTVVIDGYTTGAANYIHIYTPTETNEVGVSQRHDGTAGTGFRLAPITSTPPAPLEIIIIRDDDVRISGIEIDGSSITNAQDIDAIEVHNSVSLSGDIRLNKIIIHDLQSQDGSGSRATVHGLDLDGGNVKLSNSIIYDIVQTTANSNAWAFGVEIGGGSNHYLHNNTIFNIKNTGNTQAAEGINGVGGTVTVKNTVVLDVVSTSGSEACFAGTLTQSNNVSSDATAVGATNQLLYVTYFRDITNDSEDLHLLNDSNTLWGLFGTDLDSDPNLPVTDDVDGEARDPSTPDIGADEFDATACIPAVNFRSIGTETNPLSDSPPGIISVDQYSTIVIFSGVTLPTNIGRGDRIFLDSGGFNEEHFILSRDSDTQVTLQRPALIDYSAGVNYLINRAYNTLQAWEDARQGDLVGENRLEVGVAYNDTAFNLGIQIMGSTTDSCHYMWLTVAPGQRHAGIEGTGAVLDAQTVAGNGIIIDDDYTVVQWLEVTGQAAADKGVNVIASNILLTHLIIHDMGNDGIDHSGGNSLTARNCLIYNGAGDGINGPASGDTATIDNCTIYGMGGDGIEEDMGVYDIRNTLSMGNGGSDFLVANGTEENNISEDATAAGPGSLTNIDTTDLASPPAPPQTIGWVIFENLTPGSEDFHLKTGSVTNQAIDAGTDRSTFFSDDIDLQQRPWGVAWDIGADERPTNGSCPVFEQAWFDGDWQFRKAIVINSSRVTAALNGFPVVINLPSDAQLAADAQDDGDDILFTSSNGVTKLSHEIEKFCGGIITAACPADTGELVAWVKVPYLPSGADTTIYMYYGNASAANQEDVANVWDSNYGGVWHLKEDPSGVPPQMTDSSNNNDGTSNGSMTPGDQVSGKIDGSLVFDGSDDYIDAGTDPSLDMGAGDLTLEAWFQTTDFAGHLAGKGSTGPGGLRYVVTMGSADCAVGQIKAEIDDNGIKQFICSSAPYNDGLWHHAALVRDGTNLRLYMDGTEDVASPLAIGAYGNLDSPTRPFLIAGLINEPGPLPSALFNGGLDEVRISSASRSAQWIETQFKNQDDPANFYLMCTAATTAIELLSFTATGLDGEVLLEWETGSEVDNVGFYLYRAESQEGSYELVDPNVIPGLGSSPLGATYRYVDSGLVNGTTYYYELEDLESTGVRERHGPVSATPLAGATFETPPAEGDEGEDDSSSSSEHAITYGDPEATTLRVLKRNRRQVVLELITGGFYAEPQDDGSVRLSIPGFLEDWEPGSPAIPVKRTWLEAVVGKKVKIVSVKAKNVQAFSLRPTSADLLEPVMTPDGTVSLASKARKPGKAFRGRGLYPEKPVHLVSVAFQGDLKKAFLELSPLRWDRSTGQLLLATRLIVKVKFKGKVPGERSFGRSRGRKHRKKNAHAGSGNVVAHLVTHDSGLYGVTYESLFGKRRKGVKTKHLNLSYQGEPVAFRVEPHKRRFKRGSVLYFLSGGQELNPYGREAIYTLSLAGGGQRMHVNSASPSGPSVSHYWKTLHLEENHLFQGRLTTAPDVWLWDFLLAPVTKAYPFQVQDLAPSSEMSSLKVWIQGTTNLPTHPDHHVRIYLNGLLLDDFTLEGELPWMSDLSLLPGALREGGNLLEIENVGDTGAAYSRIMLSRFEVSYPRRLVAESGQIEGSFGESGTAEVTGLSGKAFAVDTTESSTKWLREAESLEGGLRFYAEEGHHYLVADSQAVLRPEVRRPLASRLKSMLYGAAYVVIGPESLLEASWPLLELRLSQGLTALAVPIEQIYSEFGHGETRPEAIREFLEHAYHHWRTPPRYVLLLGDATFDFKDYFGWGVQNQVPPFPFKSTYLWTASDPAYAAVNGDDLLPDLAIGRLPAANLEQAQAMVEKIVAYETEGFGLGGRAVLIADRPDPRAGDFEANAEELAATLLSGNDVHKIYLDELGTAATHDSILQALDEGASLMSYIGHGAMNLWSENILRTDHVESLDYPSQLPLLLTMNCLNGYFQFPTFDSLSETLLKADGKGIIAAFSPSGESLDGPAHFYHRLLLAELLHGGHDTLGDAILTAQSKFAESSGYLELLSIYHLFGDPAMRLAPRPPDTP